MSGVKKEYVLVSSDNRSPDSISTTDFHLRLAVPLHNVVKTDLVQVAMDYNVANIRAPHNTFEIGTGQNLEDADSTPITSTIILEEGLYTIDVLAAWIQQQLITAQGAGYSVYYSVSGSLMIECVMTTVNDGSTVNRHITADSTLSPLLGITETGSGDLAPTFNSTNGLYGTYRWTFPYSVKLGGIYPYLFIQSRALGTTIRVANGAMGFWRMVLNDNVNYSISMVNSRVDTYTDTPITLQDIDIKLVYPDGTDVNNNGGRFTLLLEIVRQL